MRHASAPTRVSSLTYTCHRIKKYQLPRLKGIMSRLTTTVTDVFTRLHVHLGSSDILSTYKTALVTLILWRNGDHRSVFMHMAIKMFSHKTSHFGTSLKFPWLKHPPLLHAILQFSGHHYHQDCPDFSMVQ